MLNVGRFRRSERFNPRRLNLEFQTLNFKTRTPHFLHVVLICLRSKFDVGCSMFNVRIFLREVRYWKRDLLARRLHVFQSDINVLAASGLMAVDREEIRTGLKSRAGGRCDRIRFVFANIARYLEGQDTVEINFSIFIMVDA